MTMPGDLPVLAIIGPTASGKSALAIAVAEVLNGEVISADSMQVYRGMDIGTAKVPVHQRRGVPHHLVDIVDPSHEITVVEFRDRGRAVIDAVRSAGRVPIICGGSGLYVSALLDDLQFGGADPSVRARWEDALVTYGAPALHEQLATVDPVAAAAILPGNGRRIVRALEYIEVMGEPFPARFAPGPAYPSVRIGLEIPWPTLDLRIEQRVRQMWAEGLVEEVRRLRTAGLGRTAAGAIGYAQALGQVAGELTEHEAQTLTVIATRRFARRQVRWMRRDRLVTWVAYDAPDLTSQVVALFRQGGQRTLT